MVLTLPVDYWVSNNQLSPVLPATSPLVEYWISNNQSNAQVDLIYSGIATGNATASGIGSSIAKSTFSTTAAATATARKGSTATAAASSAVSGVGSSIRISNATNSSLGFWISNNQISPIASEYAQALTNNWVSSGQSAPAWTNGEGESTSSFAYQGIGPLAVNGSVTPTIICTEIASGSIMMSGSTNISAIIVLAASGSLTINGTTGATITLATSGTLAVNGSVANKAQFANPISGTMTLSGLVAAARNFTNSTSGNLIFSGAVQSAESMSSSGSLILNGHLDPIFTVANIANGSLAMNGSVQPKLVNLISGSLTIFGGINPQIKFVDVINGSLNVGGVIENTIEFTNRANGSVGLSGSPLISANFVIAESTDPSYLHITGQIKPVVRINESISGELTLNGAATFTTIMNNVTDGTITTTGAPQPITLINEVGGTLSLSGSAPNSWIGNPVFEATVIACSTTVVAPVVGIGISPNTITADASINPPTVAAIRNINITATTLSAISASVSPVIHISRVFGVSCVSAVVSVNPPYVKSAFTNPHTTTVSVTTYPETITPESQPDIISAIDNVAAEPPIPAPITSIVTHATEKQTVSPSDIIERIEVVKKASRVPEPTPYIMQR
jgi:hypothetical protein